MGNVPHQWKKIARHQCSKGVHQESKVSLCDMLH